LGAERHPFFVGCQQVAERKFGVKLSFFFSPVSMI